MKTAPDGRQPSPDSLGPVLPDSETSVGQNKQQTPQVFQKALGFLNFSSLFSQMTVEDQPRE